MKLLITGGCGFLGSNLAAYALDNGIDLCVFDNLYRHGSQSNLQWLRARGSFEFVHGDIRNANDVARLVQRFQPDAVFHLAGQVAMTTSISDPRMDFEVNALGTLNLLEAVRQYAKEAAVIYSSTNKVYGDLEQYAYEETDSRYICTDHRDGFGEDVPLEFHSPYGCSKGAADQYLQDYHRIFKLKTVVLRHSSMYGGRQFATADQGWVGWFCQKAAEKLKSETVAPFTISGNGKQVRDLLHARDMVSLYFSTLDNIATTAGQAYNVGGGMANSLSLLELLTMLEKYIGRPLDYVKLPPRESDQRVFVADTSKITAATGWRPQVDAAQGVAEMLEWVKTTV